MVVFSPTHRTLLVHLCVTSYCCCAGPALLSLIIRWVESVGFWPKSDNVGHRILKSDFYPVGFCKIRLHKQAHPFLRSKNKDQKLGIRSHNKRPNTRYVLVPCVCAQTSGSDPLERPTSTYIAQLVYSLSVQVLLLVPGDLCRCLSYRLFL